MLTQQACNAYLSNYTNKGLHSFYESVIRPTKAQSMLYSASVRCAYEYFNAISDEVIVAHGFINDNDYNLTFAIVTVASDDSHWLYITKDGGYTFFLCGNTEAP